MKPSLLTMAITSVIANSLLTTAHAETDTKATSLTPIAVTDTQPDAKNTTNTNDLLTTGNTETGALLRQLNGVSAARKGGHGLDPQIRGQQYSQLNVLLDGAKIEAGCPNRMDPPSSYSEVGSYDEIEVIHGVQSVLYGAGGTGGTLLFKREKPIYNPNKIVSGEVSLLKSNVMNYEADASVKAVGKTGYIVVQGTRKEANNYTDGNGDVVKSSYDTTQGHIDLGWTPNEHHHVKLSAEKSRTEDALYPGAAMDAPETEGKMLRLQYEGRTLSKNVRDVDIDLYHSTVDHRMNNFELRDPANPNMLMETPTSTDTKGAKVQLTSVWKTTEIAYGVQYERVNKDATLYNRFPNPDVSLNFMWPDVTNTTKSVFAETKTPLTSHSRLIAGVRYDDLHAEADKINDAPTGSAMNTPSNVYNRTYRDYNGEDSANEGNLNGLLGLEQELGHGYHWYLGGSHTKRTADATERFMSKWSMASGVQTAWVGNPNIKPEEHNQIDLGLGRKTQRLSWNASLWYDRVNNYILRDLAVNQYDNGVLTSANGKTEVYVNVDAELYGADIQGDYALTKRWSMGGQFSLTKGRNLTNNRNIAMISAPTGNVHALYERAKWNAGGRFNFALEQTDIDKDYTPEANHGKTPAWSTLDIFGGYHFNRTWSLTAGIDNVFDHAYYNHLSYDITEASNVYKYNEPGRNYWARISARF